MKYYLPDGTEMQVGDDVRLEPGASYFSDDATPEMFADTGEPWTKVYDAQAAVSGTAPREMPRELTDTAGIEDTVPEKPVFMTNDRELADKALLGGQKVYFTGKKGEEQKGDKRYAGTYYVKEAPPGMKPTEAQMSAADKWPAMKERVVKHLGYDPENFNPESEASKILNEAWKTRLGGRTNLNSQEIKYLQSIQKIARAQAQKKQAMGMQLMKGLQYKLIAQEIENEKYQRGRVDKAEERKYQEDKWQKQQEIIDRRIAEREEAKDRREAEREAAKEAKPVSIPSLKSIAELVNIATGGGKEPSASDLAMIREMADQAGYNFEKVKIGREGYAMPWDDKPKWGVKDTYQWRLVPKGQAAEPGPKTVTIEGKQYKEGDIYEKDGKKFRVRVR